MIFSTTKRLFFEANFENSFSAIAEKNTILVYLCAASARFWWRSRTRIFRKTFISNVPWIWNSTTIHIRSIFQKEICWFGLAVRIPSEWLGKKSQPSKMMISWLFIDKHSCILTATQLWIGLDWAKSLESSKIQSLWGFKKIFLAQ